jgi:hypothetical protein
MKDFHVTLTTKLKFPSNLSGGNEKEWGGERVDSNCGKN